MGPVWKIRAGTGSDWRVLRMLLPQAFHHGSGARSVVAANDAGLIVGAAAISARLRSEPVTGLRVAAHVIPPFRRRGVGRQLLAACDIVAAAEGAAAIYAWEPVEAASEEAAVWAAMGFDHSVAVREGRSDIERAYEYLRPYYEQIVDRGWIPSGAKLVPLNLGDAAEIARLHVTYLGGEFAQVLDQVRGESIVRYHPDLSPVLVVDGRVMGFTLAQVLSGGIVRADSTVVHPALRGGWANLWIKFAGASACRELGIHTLVYYTYDRHTDTRKLARQVGTVIREVVEPYRIVQRR